MKLTHEKSAQKAPRREDGVVLVLCLIIVFAISTLGLSLAQVVVAQYGSFKQQVFIENTTTAAEAGVSATIAQLNSNASFTGYATEQTMYSNTARGRATYTSTVASSTGDTKIITATGRTYKTTSGGTATNTKVIKVTAAVKRDKITNSLIFGSGGLTMYSSADIPRGDIYIRGQLNMQQNAAIGSVSQSTNLNIANVGCGASSVWPQSCGAGNQPIKMLNPTPGSIYGTVCATNQTSTTGIFTGPTGSGLTPNCSPRISAAPRFNKKAFVQSVNPMPGVAPPSCPFGGGNVIIPAGTRINADVYWNSSFGICNVYLAGDVYLMGGLTLDTNVIIRAADSLGTVRPTLVVNKYFTMTGSNSSIRTNSSGTPIMAISFTSTNNGCSTNENIPSDTVHTCLTTSEAQASATPLTTYGSASASTIDFSGAILYIYYGIFRIATTNTTLSMYAVGAQGGFMAPDTTFTTVAEDAPFGNILSYPSYQPVDYQQVY